MKVVLFCGGLGTRIREYSESIPKPMVPIGHQPILWHVMQYYSQYGHQDFILCLGLQGQRHQGLLPELQADGQQRLHHLEFRQEGRNPWRTTAGLACHTRRYRHLAQYRRTSGGGPTSRQGRRDLSRQLQRWPDRCTAAGHDRAFQEKRQDRLLHRHSSADQLPSRRV